VKLQKDPPRRVKATISISIPHRHKLDFQPPVPNTIHTELYFRCLPQVHIPFALMSAAPASGAAPATKATTSDKTAEPAKDAKPAAALEEDDEFEDFPVESMLPFLSKFERYMQSRDKRMDDWENVC
jgi:hypothetical protein